MTMTTLRITVGPYTYSARFEEQASPRTCAAGAGLRRDGIPSSALARPCRWRFSGGRRLAAGLGLGRTASTRRRHVAAVAAPARDRAGLNIVHSV